MYSLVTCKRRGKQVAKASELPRQQGQTAVQRRWDPWRAEQDSLLGPSGQTGAPAGKVVCGVQAAEAPPQLLGLAMVRAHHSPPWVFSAVLNIDSFTRALLMFRVLGPVLQVLKPYPQFVGEGSSGCVFCCAGAALMLGEPMATVLALELSFPASVPEGLVPTSCPALEASDPGPQTLGVCEEDSLVGLESWLGWGF